MTTNRNSPTSKCRKSPKSAKLSDRVSPKQELEEAISREFILGETLNYEPKSVTISYETAKRLLNGINRI